MDKTVIYLGNKRHSSWSLRAWLSLKQVGIPFDEVVIPLEMPPYTQEEIRKISPSGMVPLLKHRGELVWETLSICEYLAESFPAARLWPSDPRQRALARSISAEMHAGFTDLRSYLPTDMTSIVPSPQRAEKARADIERVTAIWRECRLRYGSAGAHGRGDFLFGVFTNADSMFAPAALRFHTYAIELDPICAAYVDAIWNWGPMQEWIAAARQEPWVINYPPDYTIYRKYVLAHLERMAAKV